MNKVLILREKYPKISKAIFESFVEADTTPTKKYLHYILKMWSNKKSSSFTSNKLCEYTMKFEELLPYIENKDIYSQFYETYSNLVRTIENAIEEKENKTFKREDHVAILYENDEFLLLSPKTYKGSLKYGSSTKWCTAAKSTDSYFKSYTSKGTLCYLIDKKGDKMTNFTKIAFYIVNDGEEYNGKLDIFNEPDSSVTISKVIYSKWSPENIAMITFLVRDFAYNNNILKKINKEVLNVVDFMKKLDLNKLEENMIFLQSKKYEQKENQKIINDFIEKINKFVY